jgi:hypothetical protein
LLVVGVIPAAIQRRCRVQERPYYYWPANADAGLTPEELANLHLRLADGDTAYF